MNQFRNLTPELEYLTIGDNRKRRIIIIREPGRPADPIIDIPGTTVLVMGKQALRIFGNWMKATTNPREKFDPPLSGGTEQTIKQYYNIQKYKLDQ